MFVAVGAAQYLIQLFAAQSKKHHQGTATILLGLLLHVVRLQQVTQLCMPVSVGHKTSGSATITVVKTMVPRNQHAVS